MSRIKKIAKSLVAVKEDPAPTISPMQVENGPPTEDLMIQRGFMPARTGVKEDEVLRLTELIGVEGDENLVEAAKRRPGIAYSVGGDLRVNEPPYIFRYDEKKKKFEDNIIT